MPATVLKRALAVALTAAVSAAQSATVTPSNATDPSLPKAQVELSVVRSTDDGAMMPISQVIPLTARAADDLDPPGLTGQLFYATDQSAQRLNSSNIAYINCDPDAYKGNLQATNVLDTAITRGAIGALFFTTKANYCNVTGADQSSPFLYSMTNATTSQQVLDDLVATTSQRGQVYFAQIHPTQTQSNNDTMSTGSSSSSDQDSGSNQSNPLGPSPSTAVAMIILYSITGVITALFLVIIITGALRAHRHPERYGPGVVLNGGRSGTRQTRVRGIARAMLDTLPVVKFGDQTNQQQQRDPKPTDVEMGENTARNSAEDDQQRRSAEAHGHQAGAATATGAVGTSTADNNTNSDEGTPRDAAAGTTANASEQRPDGTAAEAGIAPAAAGSSAENLASEGDAYTGCTICTEEFEPGQDVRVLPCDHKFHPACIDPWLLNVSGTCPLCRIDLNPASPTDENGPEGHDNGTRRSASILAPPLSPTDAAAANIPAHHRRSVIRDILHLRTPGSSEERLAMARRMAGDRNAGNGTTTGDDRRRSRLSTLFRRERHAGSDEEAPPVPESSSAQSTAPR